MKSLYNKKPPPVNEVVDSLGGGYPTNTRESKEFE